MALKFQPSKKQSINGPAYQGLTTEAVELWKTNRIRNCQACDLGTLNKGGTVCMMGNGGAPSDLMVILESQTTEDQITQTPGHGPQMNPLESAFREIGVTTDNIYYTYALKCQTPHNFNKQTKNINAARKACAPYLNAEIEAVRPKAILSLGASAYAFFSNKAGLTKNRGQLRYHTMEDGSKIPVIPSFNPSSVMMNPSNYESMHTDIAKWWDVANGKYDKRKVDIVEVRTMGAFRNMLQDLGSDDKLMMTYDLETRGFKSHKEGYSKVWCAAFTKGRTTERGIVTYMVPLEHPDTPWYSDPMITASVVDGISDLVLNYSKINGHNVKFDSRWTRLLAKRWGLKYGPGHIAFDTINAAHTINEELPLDLNDVATREVGVDAWGKGNKQFGTKEGDPWDILARLQDTPAKRASKEYLGDLWGEDGLGKYCALDVAYTHLLYEKQRRDLAQLPTETFLLKNLILPGLNSFANIELNGVHILQDRMSENRKTMIANLAVQRDKLIDEHIDISLWKEAVAKQTPKDIRDGKDVLDKTAFIADWIYGSRPRGLGIICTVFTPTKQKSTKADVLKEMDHPSISALLGYKKSKKLLNFFVQWEEWMADDGRIYPYFNLTGTVTGRRSCANPNLMQVAQDPLVRNCIGARPGWVFFEADLSQIEVRLMAWASGDVNMLEIFNRGGDIYAYVVAQIMGETDVDFSITKHDVDKGDRQKGKAIVLGYLYGMMPKGFKAYAKATFNVDFTIEEATDFRDTFFKVFSGVLAFHKKQEREVIKNLQVVSFIGRVRHLLDVLSTDGYIRSKAVRKAINSPIQGLGGDWNLASIITLEQEFDLNEVVIVGDIHDAILFEIREDVWESKVKRILEVMEHPPILDKFGLKPPLRIVAEGKIGDSWGNGIEFTLDGYSGTKTIPEASVALKERNQLALASN